MDIDKLEQKRQTYNKRFSSKYITTKLKKGGNKMKKFLLVLLILLTAILGGCFGKKNSDDSGKGVNLIREENRVRVLAEDEIAGGSFIIDRELEPDNILVEADKMKIMKIANGKTYLSIVDVDTPSIEGDKLFEIKNCIGKISIELEDSINEKT